MMVRFLQNVKARGREIPAGTVMEIEERHLEKLKGMVQPLTVESSASCRIDGDLCRITYTPDLYQKHRHRDGEQITVDGVLLTLRIAEATS